MDTIPPNLALWKKLVTMVQHMWKHSTLQKDLTLNILVLNPKGNAYTRGIGLLKVLWKVVKAVIKNRVKTAVKFHDVLHGFFTCRGTGTAITENNMAH